MPLILEFGSRSGSWFALAFFSLVFGILGWAVERDVRRRSDGRAAAFARGLGLAIFLGPVTLVYASMLSGFYEAELSGDVVRLRYLLPGVVSEVPAASTRARITPAYRDRVRMVVTAGDHSYESTPWRRDRVDESLARLNALLLERR
jgi:hypothetical protein